MIVTLLAASVGCEESQPETPAREPSEPAQQRPSASCRADIERIRAAGHSTATAYTFRNLDESPVAPNGEALAPAPQLVVTPERVELENLTLHASDASSAGREAAQQLSARRRAGVHRPAQGVMLYAPSGTDLERVGAVLSQLPPNQLVHLVVQDAAAPEPPAPPAAPPWLAAELAKVEASDVERLALALAEMSPPRRVFLGSPTAR